MIKETRNNRLSRKRNENVSHFDSQTVLRCSCGKCYDNKTSSGSMPIIRTLNFTVNIAKLGKHFLANKIYDEYALTYLRDKSKFEIRSKTLSIKIHRKWLDFFSKGNQQPTLVRWLKDNQLKVNKDLPLSVVTCMLYVCTVLHNHHRNKIFKKLILNKSSHK